MNVKQLQCARQLLQLLKPRLRYTIIGVTALALYCLCTPNITETGEYKETVNNFADNANLKVYNNRQRNDSNLKYILLWNEAYGTRDYGFGFGRAPFFDNLCPETRCFATDNRELKPFEKFDAIVFHQRSLDFMDIPRIRESSQRYVHFLMESANYLEYNVIPTISMMDKFFNWTMTYRRDSDFFRPYARIFQRREIPVGRDLDSYILQFGADHQSLGRGKNRTAAWFVSNCVSKSLREVFVEELKKYIEVDVYGNCGPLKCDRAEEEKCDADLERSYWFYLSLENSVCEDYVTEKFFRIMKRNVIPVTYNGADMSKFAPPHSYINALDFESAKSLSQYLDKVAKDPALYASYFWWKDFYEVRDRAQDSNQAFCSLCSALHTDSRVKIYSDLNQWWVNQSSCRVPTFDPPLINL